MSEAIVSSDTHRLLDIVATLQSRVNDLEAREGIKEVLGRYCRAVDRLDYDLLVSCYHPDAVDEHGFFQTVGGAGFADLAISLAEKNFERMFYSLGTTLIKVSGDHATSETYCTSTKIMRELDDMGLRQLRQSGMRFLDRFEKRDGEWRISYRKLMGEWGFFHPLPTKTVGPFKVPPDETTPSPGLRDRTDPSYML